MGVVQPTSEDSATLTSAALQKSPGKLGSGGLSALASRCRPGSSVGKTLAGSRTPAKNEIKFAWLVENKGDPPKKKNQEGNQLWGRNKATAPATDPRNLMVALLGPFQKPHVLQGLVRGHQKKCFPKCCFPTNSKSVSCRLQCDSNKHYRMQNLPSCFSLP